MFRRCFSTRNLTSLALLMLSIVVCLPTPKVMAQDDAAGKKLQLVESFDLLPGEFEMILAVPEMGTLSDRAAMVNDALDLQMTGLTDLLTEFKRAMGMDRGVNGNGSLFLVVQNVQSLLTAPAGSGTQPQSGPKPQFIVMIPVSDYAEFAANFGGTADDLIATLRLPNGQGAYSKVHNGYAIISANKKMVEDYKPGMTRGALTQLLGPTGSQTLMQNSISVILQPKNISEQGYQQLIDIFKKAPAPDAAPKPLEDEMSNSKYFSGLYNAAMLRLVKDAKTIVMGLGTHEQSLNIDLAFQFKPGSTMASRITGQTQASQLLSRLPRRAYLYGFDSNLKQLKIKGIVDDAADQLGADGAWFVSLVKQASPLLAQIQDVSQAFYAPQGSIGLGTRVMNSAFVLKVDDAQQFVSGFEKFLNDANGKSHPMGKMLKGETLETDSRPRVVVMSTFAANALSDDRAKVAQFQLQYNMPMQMLAKMNDVSRRMMVLGLNNQEGYIAAVDANTVILTTVTDAQLIKDILTGLNTPEGNGLGMSAMIVKARENGIDNASGQLHLNMLSGMRATHMLIELLMGKQEHDPVFPSLLTPFSLSFKTYDAAVQTRLNLPLETIAYMRGDAQLILEPLFPKPVETTDPNTPRPDGQQRNDPRRMRNPGMGGPGMDDPGMNAPPEGF